MKVIAIATFIGLLPIIKIDISSQSRGIIRSKIDNVPVTSAVSGKIVALKLKNNALVQKGDTLLIISKENLESEKQLNDTIYKTNETILQDLEMVLKGKFNLQTSLIREEYYKYTTQKAELQSKVAQAQMNCIRYYSLFE